MVGRVTRAKAAEVSQKLHVDGDVEGEVGEGGAEVSMNRSPLAEIAGNRPGSGSGSRIDLGGGPSEDGKWSGLGRMSTRRMSGLNGGGVGAGEGEEVDVNNKGVSEPLVADKTAAAAAHAPDHSTTKNVSALLDMSHAQSNGHEDIPPTSPSSVADISTIIETGETFVSEENRDIMPNTVQRSNSPVSAPSTPKQGSGMSKSEYDALEAAVIEAATPPVDRFASPQPPSQDPISALDELDDAVENINAEVPEIQASPMKAAKVKKEKPAPAVRTTKASQARISLAHGPKDAASRAPALGRPRQSMSVGDGKRVTSTSSLKSSHGASTIAEDTAEALPPIKKEIAIPHSKPRPMSMSFPAPKPPPKSSKPVTVSNFTLPGEAMSAKFRAAREEKAKKEAEEKARRVFKARPAPNTSRAPAAVRQTSTSKARESLMGGAAGGKPSARTTDGAHVRANSVASSRPAVTSFKPKTTTTGLKSTVPAKTVNVPKRASTAMGVFNQSTAGKATGQSVTTLGQQHSRVTSSGHTAKGKEVFGRVAQGKVEAEREKREREEAAKRARVEAAERSRILSREWAERKRGFGKKVGGDGGSGSSAVVV